MIKQGDSSVLNIGEGDNNITNHYYAVEGISEEMYERLYDKYGANKALIQNFLTTLNHKNVPSENFQAKLEEIAKHYQFLTKRLARFTPQDPETNQLKQAAQIALNQGNYTEAEKLLNHASDRDKEKADNLEKEIEKMQTAFIQRRLSAAAGKANNGDLHITQLKYASAAAYFEEAANLVPAGKEKILVNYLNQAGTAYQNAGLYPQAKLLLEKSLLIREKIFGKTHLETAKGLSNIAVLYRFMGQYEKAIPLYQQTLAILDQAVDVKSIANRAINLNHLAELYHQKGLYKKALPLYQQALEILKKQDKYDLSIAIISNNMGLLYNSMGQYWDAFPLYNHALKVNVALLGHDHPFSATILNNIAMLFFAMKDYDMALQLYKKSVGIKEKILGTNHLETVSIQGNIAEVYSMKCMYQEALILNQRILAVKKARLDKNHPSIALTMNNLALVYEAMGKYQKALPLYKHALKIREQVLDPTHPYLISSLHNLAGFYEARGEHDKALHLYQKIKINLNSAKN